MSSAIFSRCYLFIAGKKGHGVLRLLSSEALRPMTKPESRCRTLENNPVYHKWEHEGHVYCVPESTCTQLFKFGGIPKFYKEQADTFGEMCLMVRKPALEVINCMNHADYSRPVVRYVLYGEPGVGKSLSLAHILHYGFNSNHLLIHVPWVPNWMKYCKDHCSSETREGFRDTPMDSAAWLVHFKTQNQHLLSANDLTVSEKYIWSKREETLPGVPLVELVNLGINRIKYASEIIVALVSEIKKLSIQGRCKTLVAIDGFNAFLIEDTDMKNESKKKVLTSELTVTEAFMNLTKYDWNNGSVVLTVDQPIWRKCENKSGLPLYQLGKKGFEHLDPFVPIKIPPYSDKEFQSCIDYYVDRNWIQNKKAHSAEGRDELFYLSVGNPLQVMKLCGHI